MTNSLKINLTDEEAALLDQIELEALKLVNGQPARENGERAAQLATRLLERGAIPPVRKKVFADSDYATGRGPSVREQFRRHGNSPEETLRHPHFLAWLRYFIFGPDLPANLIEAYATKLDDMGMITSGDVGVLATYVRAETRKYGLIKSQADKIFKLALEHDDDIYLAQRLRREVLKTAKAYRASGW